MTGGATSPDERSPQRARSAEGGATQRVAFAAGADTVAHVFVDDVAGDDDLVIAGADGHHLQRVRRLRPDEGVTASDGHGVWRAVPRPRRRGRGARAGAGRAR